MGNKDRKRRWASLTIRETQSKGTMRCLSPHTRRKRHGRVRRGCGEIGTRTATVRSRVAVPQNRKTESRHGPRHIAPRATAPQSTLVTASFTAWAWKPPEGPAAHGWVTKRAGCTPRSGTRPAGQRAPLGRCADKISRSQKHRCRVGPPLHPPDGTPRGVTFSETDGGKANAGGRGRGERPSAPDGDRAAAWQDGERSRDGRTAATDCTLRSDKMASVRYVYLTTVNKVEGPRGGRGVRG